MVGGAFSRGLPKSDFKSFESVQGTFREFMDRVEKHYATQYGKESKEVKLSMRGAQFEPKVARLIFEQMLNEQKGIHILLKHRLESVNLKASENKHTSINSIRLKNLDNSKFTEVSGKMFIDATYEGDLMANAGVPYRVGGNQEVNMGNYMPAIFMFLNIGIPVGEFCPEVPVKGIMACKATISALCRVKTLQTVSLYQNLKNIKEKIFLCC